MGVFPNFGAVGASGDLRSTIGALLMYVLLASVAMLIVSAIAWAIATPTGHVGVASKARAGILASLIGAVLAGSAIALVNFVLSVGSAAV
jgi:hypothetical protein